VFKFHLADFKAKRVKVINEPAFAKLSEKVVWAVYTIGEKKPSSSLLQ